MVSNDEVNDIELVHYCLSNNRKYQELLYKRYASKMYSICLSYAKNKDDAKDILQNGFVKIFTSLNNYKNSGSLEGWIKKIIINTAIDSYRKEIVDLRNVGIEYADTKEIEASILEEINTKELMSLVHKLPEGARIIFNLYAIEGYNHAEISEMLNISIGTSKSQFSRAKTLLQNWVQNIYSLKIVPVKIEY